MGRLGYCLWIIGDGDVTTDSLRGVVCRIHDHVGECAFD